jgi:hypothetical protein
LPRGPRNFQQLVIPQAISPYLPPEPSIPPDTPIANAQIPARYYIDVTDYGAVSSATIDNTAAIQAAINAACNPPTIQAFLRPILFFPPGYYSISQPQAPSTDSPLTLPCTIEIEGSGTFGGAQFSELAHGSWLQVQLGPKPNAAAALTYIPTTTTAPKAIIRNMAINGGNQALAIYGAVPTVLENVCLVAQATGLPDNTPLKVTDTVWFWYRGGCLQSPSPAIPVAIFSAEVIPSLPGAEQLVGDVYMSDLITAGDGMKYFQRVSENVGVAGNFVFRNISLEDAGDVLEISETCTNCTNWIITSLTFDHVAGVDSACLTCSIVHMNAPSGRVSGIVINHGFAGNAGRGRAITVSAGRLGYHSINTCLTNCVTAVVDGDGNPLWNYTGHVTLSGGTRTIQFYPIEFPVNGNPPVCITNDETRINGSNVVTTRDSMTISGGPSDVVDWACFVDDPYPID